MIEIKRILAEIRLRLYIYPFTASFMLLIAFLYIRESQRYKSKTRQLPLPNSGPQYEKLLSRATYLINYPSFLFTRGKKKNKLAKKTN